MRTYILQLCLAIVLGAFYGVVYSSCLHTPPPTPTGTQNYGDTPPPTPTGTQNYGDCEKAECPI